MVEDFQRRGWVKFAHSAALAEWVAHAQPYAKAALEDPALGHWWVCEKTWFVGVDALPNSETGVVADGPPLAGAPIDWIVARFGAMPPLHRAQVSVVTPGYPRPRDGESAAAFRYRQKRDAAHVDGLKAEGAARLRTIAEPHAFILGIPMTRTPADAAPLVVWEGSHEIVRAGLLAALRDVPPREWGRADVTAAYQAARQKVFETCRRVEISAQPGESYVLHRLALHGVAAWPSAAAVGTATGGAKQRMIVYFRPILKGGAKAWLSQP